MQSEVNLSRVEYRAETLQNLISVLIDLFPDSPGDKFDHDAYFAVLCKVYEDASAVNAMLRTQPDALAIGPHRLHISH